MTKHNTPALRFDGFEGEWGEQPLITIADRVQTKNTKLASTLPLTISALHGLVDQITYFNNRVASSNLTNYLLIHNGEFAYNKSYSEGYPVGAVKRLDGYDKGVLSSLYVVFRLLSERDVDSNFILSFFETSKWHRYVEMQSAEGARNHGLLNISADTFMGVPVSLAPSLEEQRAIGELFTDLDALIEQHRAKHSNLQQTKTALMQRMFPQDGADEPELRLGGFSGAWEIQPFSDLVAYRGHNSLSRADLTDVPTSAMNIHYGDILVKYDSVVDVSRTDIPFVRDVERLSNLSRQSLSDGDILFADAAEDSTVGKCVEVQGISDNLVLAGLHTISARPIRTFAPGFLGHALNAPSFHNQLLSKMQGTKVSSISISTLAETVFSFPTLEEQRAIGEVFSNLDALIAAEHRFITQLTQAKTALLQRMFV